MIKNMMVISIFVGVGFLGCGKKAQIIAPLIEEVKVKESPSIIKQEPIMQMKIETPKVIKQEIFKAKVINKVEAISTEVVAEKLEPIKNDVIVAPVEKIESEEETKVKEMKYMIEHTPLILKNKSAERAYE